jgi:hypothetical protein
MGLSRNSTVVRVSVPSPKAKVDDIIKGGGAVICGREQLQVKISSYRRTRNRVYFGIL